MNDSANGVDISFHSTLQSRSDLELAALLFLGEKNKWANLCECGKFENISGFLVCLISSCFSNTKCVAHIC